MKTKKNIDSHMGQKTCRQNIVVFKNKQSVIKNNGKMNNRKLFSLQHQTLSILRHAEKYHLKYKNTFDKITTNSSIIKDNGDEKDKSICFNQENRDKDLVTEVPESHDIHDRYTSKPESDSFIKLFSSKNDIMDSKSMSKIKQRKKIKKINHSNEATTETTASTENLISSLNKNSPVINLDTNFDQLNFEDSIVKLGTGKERKKRSSSNDKISEKKCNFNESNNLSRDSFSMKNKFSTFESETRPSESSKNINGNNFDFYQFNKTKVLLTMLHPCSLCFIGVLEIEVLAGTIDLIGYSINRNSGKNIAYSPKGSTHLSIKTSDGDRFDDRIVQVLSNYGIPNDKIKILNESYGESIVLLVLKRDCSDLTSVVWPNFVEKYSNHSLLPKINTSDTQYSSIEVLLQSTFQLQNLFSTKLYNEMDDWKSISDLVNTNIHRTIICGGKGVGKSTLLRYLVNRSLSTISKKVLVIDMDPGQPEFMVPGCLSAFIVTSPLLGPSFTHFLDPIVAGYYGFVEATESPNGYYESVQNVVDFCNNLDEAKNIPWFINTMGFNKGFGLLLTSSVIKKVLPTVLIQIEGEHKSRNFQSLLTPEFVEQHLLHLCRINCPYGISNYQIISTKSAVRSIPNTKQNRQIYGKTILNTWGLSSSSIRSIMILSYFGQLLNSKVKDIFQVEPYVVNMNDVYLNVFREPLHKEAILDAINGQLVALCKRNPVTSKIVTCYGYGIVRAINKESRELFLITPLKEDKLELVNSLVKGSISLPDKVFCEPSPTVSGHVPYVTVTNNILSSYVKKTFKKS